MFVLSAFRLSAIAFLSLATLLHARPLVVAYVPNWIELKSFAEEIDYPKITHINIAFENPINDDGDLSFNPSNTVVIDKAKASGVKVLISIGGGAASGDKKLLKRYGDLLADESKRKTFAAKLAVYVTEHHFDGLDVDIEGPSITKDYGAFISDLAIVLKPQGSMLTAALSKGYGGDRVPDSVFAHFDLINIMAYDGAGYWSPDRPGQHSSLEMAKDSVAYWLKRGLPKSKAVLGVPFYGYGFGDAFLKRDYPYKTILAKYPGAELTDQIGSTIWYNGIPTIQAKCNYATEQGLAGIMIWSLDSDVKGEKSLLGAIHESLANAPQK